jgi:hypothetical protein
VSGAVQDLDVGVVVGEDRTFGKGLVQNIEALPYNTALKFTVAKYYTPSGRCIQATEYDDGGAARKKGDGIGNEEKNGNKDAAAMQRQPQAPAVEKKRKPQESSSDPDREDKTFDQNTDNKEGDTSSSSRERKKSKKQIDSKNSKNKKNKNMQGGGGDGTGRFSARVVDASERKEFLTRNSGRVVRDGGGIEVDLKVSSPKVSLVEALLTNDGAIFDFASKWTQVRRRHEWKRLWWWWWWLRRTLNWAVYIEV